jgi:hypothetical protein
MTKKVLAREVFRASTLDEQSVRTRPCTSMARKTLGNRDGARASIFSAIIDGARPTIVGQFS